jgi:hypothetical protein
MSEVSICNLALSHIGDRADVTSISPPENSVQAQLCAQFYPAARNALLEMGSWGFATRRKKLAALAVNPTVLGSSGCGTWRYAYGLPSDCINAIAVISANAPDDYEAKFGGDRFRYSPQGYLPVPGSPDYTPKPFATETQDDGTQILLTNVCDAVLRYTVLVTDTTKFSPLFTMALSYLLASMLAGPIIKGEEGAQMSESMLKLFKSFEDTAEASDANQRKIELEPAVSWIRGR